MRAAWVSLCVLLSACQRSVPPPPADESPSVTDSAAVRDALETERERWRRERKERQLDSIDPGELIEHARRHSQDHIEAGQVPVALVFQQGEAMFERRFTPPEGLGFGKDERRGLSRVQRASLGPDALSCVECHHRGGDDGTGEQHQRAWLGGDGRHLDTAQPRVAPHLSGLGAIQLLAAEMSADLQARVAQVTANPGASTRFELTTENGVSFGALKVVDGGLDWSELHGVDGDLVVKPFGWKGEHATLRSFVRTALPQHLGLEPLPIADGGPLTDVQRKPWLHDEDGDGVFGEVAEGQLTAMAVYLALLDVPQVRPPRAADLREAWSRGESVFARLECGTCHRPTLALRGKTWTERTQDTPPDADAGLTFDLLTDAQVRPSLEQADYGRKLEVTLFSDLKRHDMGPTLATQPRDGGVGSTWFLTRPLWGLGTRAPAYLHDGRARTLADAVLAHDGEGRAARDRYAASPEDDRRALTVYLLSLRRQPMARFLP